MNQEGAAKLLADASRAGVFHLPQRGRKNLRAAADALGFARFTVSLEDVRDKAAFLAAVSRALTFPAWFGHNWDALEDCLSDLSWRPAPGYLVTLSHADDFRVAQPADFHMALRIFSAAADAWRDDTVPFWTLVELHGDSLPYLPDLPDLPA
jgi:RNAse (barnase) inhibitor barstar